MPVKRKPIPKKTRIKVWEKYGKKCAYCGCDLEYKDMQVDHADSVAFAKWRKTNPEELDSEDNLMPACRMCNYYKSASGIEGFRKKLKKQLTHSSIASFQTRLAIKYGMVIVSEWDGKFWFEKYKKENEQD